jgi:hypothetical protein
MGSIDYVQYLGMMMLLIVMSSSSAFILVYAVTAFRRLTTLAASVL